MHRILEHTQLRVGRAAFVAALAVTAAVVPAFPAGANTGHVIASQTCDSWSTSVTLDNNVKPDFFVEVTTTIPGTTGIVDGHYNTIGNSGTTPIWNASGVAPAAGTVTLTILNPDRSVDSTTSASLTTLKNCTPSTTTQVSASTTPPPTTTGVAGTATTSTVGTTAVPTSTTLPPRATGAPTTSIEVSPISLSVTTTTMSTTVSALAIQASPTSTTTATQPVSATGTLPRTGSGTLFPTVFGVSCIAAGALLTLRRRGVPTRT